MPWSPPSGATGTAVRVDPRAEVGYNMIEADRGGRSGLVDVAWLQAHLDDADVLAVEVGADAAAYYEGHVPGAAMLSWFDDLHEPRQRGVLSQSSLERLLGRTGITPDTHLVLYGEQDNAFAAYAYWLLRYYRHRSLSLLDGGRRAWVAAGGPLTLEVPELPTAAYRSSGPDPSLRATRDLLLERYVGAPPGSAVVDCRHPRDFAGRAGGVGDVSGLRRRLGGHVPGARNVPHDVLLDASTGLLQPREVLQDRFAGLAATDDIVVYCDVGGHSSLEWIVLHDLLGYQHVRVYDGGWAEYGSLTEAPVAR